MVSLVSRDVTVTNRGPAAVTITEVRITNERFPDRESASQFFVRPGSCAGYRFPPNGGACVLTVYFAPTVPGDFEATLELALSPGEAQVIPLSAAARAVR